MLNKTVYIHVFIIYYLFFYLFLFKMSSYLQGNYPDQTWGQGLPGYFKESSVKPSISNDAFLIPRANIAIPQIVTKTTVGTQYNRGFIDQPVKRAKTIRHAIENPSTYVKRLHASDMTSGTGGIDNLSNMYRFGHPLPVSNGEDFVDTEYWARIMPTDRKDPLSAGYATDVLGPNGEAIAATMQQDKLRDLARMKFNKEYRDKQEMEGEKGRLQKLKEIQEASAKTNEFIDKFTEQDPEDQNKLLVRVRNERHRQHIAPRGHDVGVGTDNDGGGGRGGGVRSTTTEPPSTPIVSRTGRSSANETATASEAKNLFMSTPVTVSRESLIQIDMGENESIEETEDDEGDYETKEEDVITENAPSRLGAPVGDTPHPTASKHDKGGNNGHLGGGSVASAVQEDKDAFNTKITPGGALASTFSNTVIPTPVDNGNRAIHEPDVLTTYLQGIFSSPYITGTTPIRSGLSTSAPQITGTTDTLNAQAMQFAGNERSGALKTGGITPGKTPVGMMSEGDALIEVGVDTIVNKNAAAAIKAGRVDDPSNFSLRTRVQSSPLSKNLNLMGEFS